MHTERKVNSKNARIEWHEWRNRFDANMNQGTIETEGRDVTRKTCPDFMGFMSAASKSSKTVTASIGKTSGDTEVSIAAVCH